MYTQADLIHNLKQMNIDPKSTLLIHSSMKSIGPVDGGAETVLSAFEHYMHDGLLVLPTHTWAYIKAENPKYYVTESPSCIGILPELFRKRDGVLRSWHPTHSVAAKGKDAASFIAGAERFDTPCARGSAWGKLLDRRATIMLVGVDFRRNTFIHGIEEWVDIPGRMTDSHEALITVLPNGSEISVPSRRHCGKSWSLHFWKVEEVLEERGAWYRGKLGDANVYVCDTVKLNALLTLMLKKDPHLFSDNEPLTESFKEWFLKATKIR